MKDYLKFLEKLPKSLRLRLIKVIDNIAIDNLKNLDVKSLKGYSDFYRCRVGKIRIVFEKRNGLNIVHDIGFRCDIYKKM